MFRKPGISEIRWFGIKVTSDAMCVLRMMQPVGALVAKCKTMDQARAVVTFLDAASEKSLRATVALTAARGRGKVQAVTTATELALWCV